MIITLPLGIMQANCYIIYDKHSLDGIIVDPGGEATRVLEEIEEHTIKVHYILNTHGHFDHVAGNASLKSLNAPLAIHPNDRDLLLAGGGASWFGLPYTPSPEPTVALNEGQVLHAGTYDIKIIHTPGHTPGSVCFHIPKENALLTGDLLFAGSIGRSDLPGGNARILTKSLKRMLDFPTETAIYPGHGPTSTLAQERRTNPWLNRMTL